VTAPPLTLVSHALCPYVQRAAIVLAEKGVAYRRIDIDLAAKPDWFVELSPFGKTPLLRVGATALFESAVICEYLDETVLPRLHPVDPLERARHRAGVELASALLSSIGAFYDAADAAGLRQRRDELVHRFRQFDAALGDGPFFAGTAFGMVDAAIAPAFRYVDVFDTLQDFGFFDATPKVRRWRAALTGRPSVRAAVRTDYPERLLGFLRKRPSMLGATARSAGRVEAIAG
jgi:glutathione S-transferase